MLNCICGALFGSSSESLRRLAITDNDAGVADVAYPFTAVLQAAGLCSGLRTFCLTAHYGIGQNDLQHALAQLQQLEVRPGSLGDQAAR
jgi:hypothetical protein